MQRDPGQLTGRTFDVLVVGGGIYGLAIAYDAAQRGLSVALIEQDDFGSGASFNHLRTIHGGLRHLQRFNLARARESMIERRTMAAIAPHAVRPLPFVLPLERSLHRGASAMRAGFLVDRLIGYDRNRGVLPSHRLPAGQIVRGEALRQFGATAEKAGAAAVWYDYVTTEADRLTFSFALAAAQNGAVLANHVEAMALSKEGQRIAGAHVQDRLTGRELDISARVTVNATGGAVDRLLSPIEAPTGIPMLTAMNLVTRRAAGEAAVGGLSASGRHLFLVPWRGRALFGTWESASTCTPDQAGIAETDVAAFIGELNHAFPRLDLMRDDVTMIHRGIVPAVVSDGRVTLEGHETLCDHAADGTRPIEGLLSVVGAKYTTARAVAERATDCVISKLARQAAPCRTAATPLPGGDIRSFAAAVEDDCRANRDLGAETIAHLTAAYGSRSKQILALSVEQPSLRATVADSPVIGAELVWAARHEMAVTLADAVVRRTPLGALGYPGAAILNHAAALLAEELCWPAERRDAEVEEVRRFFARVRCGS
jgi:glycerol-3-phosphate dehydrogenase